MAKAYKARWHKENGCWTSACGDWSKSGDRRKAVYFRDIPYGPPGSANHRKAQAALAAYLEKREEATVRSDTPTLGRLATLYLQWLTRRVETGKAKPLTLRGHTAVLRKFKTAEYATGRAFQDMPAPDLSATAMAGFVNGLVDEGHAPNYIARIVASVQTVLNWAAKPTANRDPERLIPANPIGGFRHEATRAPQPADRYAPENEVRAFLDWGYRRAANYVRVGNAVNRFGDVVVKGGEMERRFERITIDLIRVAYLTGTRPGELRVAEWGDFRTKVERVEGIEDWCGRIQLDPTRWKSGSKTGKPRDVILVPEAVKVIEAIADLPDHHPRFIFTHRRGNNSRDRAADNPLHGEPWTESSLPNKICTLRRQAIQDGVPLLDEGENRFVMYRLRHSRAAELLMSGVDMATTAKLLGTSVTMIANVYSSFTGKFLAEAAARQLVNSARRLAGPGAGESPGADRP